MLPRTLPTVIPGEPNGAGRRSVINYPSEGEGTGAPSTSSPAMETAHYVQVPALALDPMTPGITCQPPFHRQRHGGPEMPSPNQSHMAS